MQFDSLYLIFGMPLLDTNFKRGLLALVGSVFVDVSVGEFNLLSFLYLYFSSYFQLVENNNLLVFNKMTIFPQVWQACSIFSPVVGIFVYKKIGFRACFFLFVLIFSSG
jgi:hypothetical protein